MAIQSLSAERMRLFRIPQSSEGAQRQTETGKSIFLHLFTVGVNYPFPSFTMTNRLNANTSPIGFLHFKRVELLAPIATCHFVNLHFRPSACGGSRVLLAHTRCWGGGFCLLCRQASMARWARYYSRGSSAADLEQKNGEKNRDREER